MNSNLTKKFFKKNMLLQQNLEKFLTWRDNKKDQTYSIKFSKKSQFFAKSKGVPTCGPVISAKVLNGSTAITTGLEDSIANATETLPFGSSAKAKVTNGSLILFKKKIFGSKQIYKKLYRPIESKSSNFSFKQKFLSDFFPHKKPFMHFWIFPLLGCCFLSVMTLNKNTVSRNKFNNFSPLQFPLSNMNNFDSECIKKGSTSTQLLKNLLLTTQTTKNTEVSFNKLLLKRSKQQFFNSTDLPKEGGFFSTEDFSFSANYAAKMNKLYQKQTLSKNSLSIEFENLCLFYLNLTNQNLTSSFKNYSFHSSKKSSEIFLENSFHKNFIVKGPALFDWTWHSLQMNQKKFFSLALDQSETNKLINLDVSQIEKNKFFQYLNIEHFPQKMKKNNLILENWNSYLSYLADLKSHSKFSRVPHISYYHAAELLDAWIKVLELDSFNIESSTTENKQPSNLNLFIQLLRNDLKNTEKGSLIDLFERVYILENFLLTSSKKINNLALNFSILLNKITENQNNLKKIFSKVNLIMDQMQSNKKSSNDLNFVPKTQKSEFISYKNVIEKIQNKYRYHLIKLWLDNSFSKIYSQTLYSKGKTLFSTQIPKLLNTDKNSIHFQNSQSNGSSNQEKSLKFQTLNKNQKFLLLKDSRSQSSLIKNNFHILNTEFKSNNFLEKKLKKVLNFTVFSKLSKQKFLLKNKTKTVLTKIQSVHRLQFALQNSIMFNQDAMLRDSKFNTQLSWLNSKKNLLPISLKTLDSKLKHLTYELMLLQYWKKFFPETFSLQNYTSNLYAINKRFEKLSFKTNKQFYNLVKTNSVANSNLIAKNRGKEFVCLTNKLVKEINLYRQLKSISQKFVEFPFYAVNYDAQKFFLNQKHKLTLDKNRVNKIFKYKTPILFSDIQTLEDFSLGNENKLILTSQTQKFLKTDWKLHPKYWTQTPLFFIDLASKQTHLASSIIPSKQSNLFALNSEKRVFSHKMNFLKFFLDKIRKKEFLSLKRKTSSGLFINSTSFRNLDIYLNKNPIHFKKVKKFFITKEFSDFKNQKISLLKPFKSLNSNKTKNFLKYYKLKSPLKSKSSSVFEKRKAEKIFRTYLSVKSLENQASTSSLLNTSSQSNSGKTQTVFYNKRSFKNILPILKKLRKIVKAKKISLKKYTNKISFNLLKNSTLKDTELFLKRHNSSNFIKKPFVTSNTSDFLKSPTNLYLRSLSEDRMKSNRFQSKTFLKKLGGALNFLKKSNFSITETEKRRLEKRKVLQKKRRLKKLKLENRRRKKRKRFYPRPHYLRFQLYYSFLQKRHPQNNKKQSSQSIFKSNVQVNNGDVLTKKLQPLVSNTQHLIQSNFLNTESNTIGFKEKIYRKKRQKWGNISLNLFSSEKLSLKKLSLGLGTPTYHQKEFYKISNETLTEFERLCWKSYWLRSNLTPYIRCIQTNLKTMQQKEILKQSEITFFNILKNLVPWSSTQGSRLIFNLNNSNIKKQMKSFTPAYLNVKDTLDDSFFKQSSLTFFKKLENKSEYDRLIYERITDEMKNVKSQLNVDGQNHARSYKPGRQKLEKPISKNFFNSFNTFYNHFLEPKIQPFSVFSVINDSSIKPFGDLPTLRLLWACNKTNLFTYNENNFSRTLWSTYKNREQTKNNKTKKFISKLFKTYSFIPTNIDSISSTKTKLAFNKIQLFGGFIYGKNYNSYLRQLKYNLQMTRISKLRLFKKEKSLVNSDIFLDSNHSEVFDKLDLKNSSKKNQGSSTTNVLTQRLPFEKKTWFENNLTQKPQKRMIHFWWSTKQVNPIEQIFSFWMMAPIVYPSLDFYINENTNSMIQKKEILRNESFTNLSESVSFLQTNDLIQMNLNKTVILTSFWICCLLFHISILFTVIRIPEIRSLAKFQFLILSKLANTYLTCLFSIYDLVKDYQTKISYLMKKSLKFSIKDSSSSLKFSTTASLDQFYLNDQISQINWNKKNTFKMNYTQKFLTNKTYKELRKIGNFQNQMISLNKFSAKELQNQVKFIEQKTKHKQKALIQSTLIFEWNFREFVHFSKTSQKNQSKMKKIDFIQKNFHFLILHSINPFFGKFNKSAKINVVQNHLTNHWFYSWYTGFLWYTFFKPLENSTISEKKQTYLKQNFTQFLSLVASKTNVNTNASSYSKKNLKTVKENFSNIVLSNIQIQSILSLLTLYFTKMSVNVFYFCFNMFYKLLFQLIDIMEGILFIFYKFLEKPAELMVEWIAEIFLIEWSSDFTTYVPEAFDTTLWNSALKISRSTRPLSGFVFSFLIQRTFLNSIEIFYNWVFKPDTDLIVRQKKGIIFWDIWTEILIQAAETYKMNLSSLGTIKEEQELLIENLLEDKGPLGTFALAKEIQMKKKKIDLSKTLAEKSTFNNTNFFNSNLLKVSLSKMDPLMKFLQTYPKNPTVNSIEFSNANNSKIINNLFYPRQFFISETQFYNLSSFQIENQSSSNTLEINMALNPYKKWAVSQYLTTQGRDTDLFMDIHPPKSFLHISFLKTYLPAQEILGSLVCDIYSGLFTQKISKNVLVVGAPGSAKSFFIQALAGETELKIVTDNAHRYALVQGGVPIGMKLLRDVFDSIALHTPCLFLLEDIHVIGERRPMLISDDENSKAKDSTFGAEQEEVHEKNRLIYQLSRHVLSHYKRPYKGDFSLSIPTNHFCYDLFLGISPPRKRRSELTAKSPFPIVQLEKPLEGKDQSYTNKEDSKHLNENKNFALKQTLLSSLQISTEQIFAPPATSPFNILLMKEQKKLKPKKFVKELPWSGLSYDQFMLISKSHYSVRVKVALLAEMAMTNLSIKLDMITDLLVIIDSVRSNRGFVVFATTHVPSLLDPALRRPGRLDETISLPLLPNLISRFEIFKTNLSSYSELTDLLDYSLLTSKAKLNENQIYTSISKSLLLLLNAKKVYKSTQSNDFLMSQVFPTFFNDYPIYSFSQAFQTSINLNSSLINISQLKNCLIRNLKNKKFIDSRTQKILSKQNLDSLLNKQTSNLVLSGNDKFNYISLTYSQAGQFLVESLIIHDQTTYSSKFPTHGNELQEIYNTEEQIFKTLYNSKIESNHTLFKLFAGKISQFFVLNSSPRWIKFNSLSVSSDNYHSKISSTNLNSRLFSTSFSDNLSFEKKESISMKKAWWLTSSASLQTTNPPSQASIFENIQNFQTYWQSATSFLDSFFQKRYLYNKNAIVSKMLLFEDTTSLREPPSPPNSSILMPAKKFENYKRTLRDFIQKPMLTINEKIQIHHKQRFLKLLYNVPIQTSFTTISNQKNLTNSFKSPQKFKATNFYNSFKELGYLDLLTLKPTSSYCFYKNRFLTRQRFSFLNQWWNGQLAEHNVETTYLSHVDWRSMFVQSLGDLVIDFPDADQYYNPRSRRWFLNSDSWGYWLSFEKNLTHEISLHYILNCFTKTSNLLNENREFFDYLAFRFLRYHQLKEIDLLHSLIRFYKNKEC